MSSEANKAIVQRFVEECVNTGNFDALATFVARDVVFHDADPGQAAGREGIRQAFTWFHSVFPDLRNSVDDLLAEDDRVVSRWTMRGSQQGEMLGIPASGKQVIWRGIDMYRIADGKIVDWWRSSDVFGVLQQLRAGPGPAEMASGGE